MLLLFFQLETLQNIIHVLYFVACTFHLNIIWKIFSDLVYCTSVHFMKAVTDRAQGKSPVGLTNFLSSQSVVLFSYNTLTIETDFFPYFFWL